MPADIESDEVSDRYYFWADSEASLSLYKGGSATPLIIPGDAAQPYLRRNDWNRDFNDSEGVRTQNLNSTRVLSSDA